MSHLLDKGALPPQGRFWPVDARGCIANDASAEQIDPLFCHAIAQAVDAYRRNLKDGLHSIYVTGSVARGRARAGRSNLDMAAVLRPKTGHMVRHEGWLDIAAVSATAGQYAAPEIAMSIYAWEDVFPTTNQFSRAAFILGTSAVCVWGPDLEPHTPRLPFCAAIANDAVVSLAARLEAARTTMLADPSACTTRRCCRTAMRAILHAAFALVMLEEEEHTRDLDLARDLFLLHHPERKDDVIRVFRMAQSPSDDGESVLALLDRVRDWIIPQADTWLDRYNQERLPALPLPA